MKLLTKSTEMFAVLARRPEEFVDRISGSLSLRLESYSRRRPGYSTQGYDETLRQLGKALSARLDTFMAEAELAEIVVAVKAGLAAMPSEAPFPAFHNGDFRMARLCYAVVRALQPVSIVETGVCYGVTSAFILKALERNGGGVLYSIDLPPIGRNATEFVGRLVPSQLRSRWRLFFGSARRLLPRLASEVGAIDFFLHDSLHTYANISRELATITPKLAKRSLVFADDIENNTAFLDWAARSKPTYWAAIAEESKPSLLGVAVVLGSGSSSARMRAEACGSVSEGAGSLKVEETGF